jgi:LacI family transcriptional regulator
MEMVAQQAGVSITTVSHVINKTRHVNQETKDAVLRVMKELNYHSSKMAKSDTANGTCIGVILADAREDYYVAMIKTVETAAADYGVSIIFSDSEADFEKEKKNIDIMLGRVNGLLLAPVDADRMPKALSEASIPVVLIDRQYESHNFLVVGINNFRSSFLGAKSLIEKGCKKIGFIGYSDPVSTIRQRIQGYKSALLEADEFAAPKVLYLKYIGGDYFPLIKQFILDENFDGFMCATSSLCNELVEVLDSLDEGIQNKLKIISFDDNPWFDYLKYPISVISQPVAEIGNAALENLLQFIEQTGDNYNVKRELLFDTAIIDRTANYRQT